MNDHDHAWSPQQGEMGCYVCPCGATGFRRRDGSVVAHKSKRRSSARWTAMDRTHNRGDGRVAALPDLDQTERRSK